MKLNASNIPQITLLIRYVQAGLSLLCWVLAISAVALTPYSYYSTDAFGVALGILTFIWLAYIIVVPTRYPHLTNGVATVITELVMIIFWFASFIASAAQRGPDKCGDFGGWTYANDWKSSCRVAKAYIVFAAFTWLSFVFTTIFTVHTALPFIKQGLNSLSAASTNAGGTIAGGAASAQFNDMETGPRDVDGGLQPEETAHVSDEPEKDVNVAQEQDLSTAQVPNDNYVPYTSENNRS